MTKATGTTRYIQSEELINNEEFGEQLLQMAINLNNLATESYWKLGDIRQSVQSESVFQAKKGDNWVLLNGQDITGSDLHSSYGISLLPNAAGATLGQARIADSIFDITASQNKSHTHFIMNAGPASGNAQNFNYWSALDINGQRYFAANTTELPIWSYITGRNGENEARPYSLSVNYFVKINNTPTNF